MTETLLASLLHYGSVVCIVGISSFSVSIGECLATLSALDAIERQPAARSDILRAHILGAALIEGSAIFGLLIAILLIGLAPLATVALKSAIAEMGICIAMSVTCGILGVVSGFPIVTACASIARQPFMSQKIVSFMIMTQALIQTPLISALLVSAFITLQIPALQTTFDGIRLCAAGIAIGLGCIGPTIGLALCARNALRAISVSKKLYNKILSFTLLSEAIIETPIVFSLIISFLLLFLVHPLSNNDFLRAIALVSATICTGLGTFGAGIASGNTAKNAILAIAYTPDSHGQVTKMSFLAQGLIETSVIYATLIAVVLIFLS